MIKFACPGCGQHLQADDDQAGSAAGACPKCNAALTVPKPAWISSPLTSFNCPVCSGVVWADASQAGTIVTCPQCKSDADVPIVNDVPATARQPLDASRIPPQPVMVTFGTVFNVTWYAVLSLIIVNALLFTIVFLVFLAFGGYGLLN